MRMRVVSTNKCDRNSRFASIRYIVCDNTECSSLQQLTKEAVLPYLTHHSHPQHPAVGGQCLLSQVWLYQILIVHVHLAGKTAAANEYQHADQQ